MQDRGSKYAGPERRRRKVYFTRNTEYHFLDEVCVAVRRRDTGQWRMGHIALQRTLSGSVRITPSGDVQPKAEPPQVGDALFREAGVIEPLVLPHAYSHLAPLVGVA